MEENLDEYGESLVVHQILLSKFLQCLMTLLINKANKQGFAYLPKVSDGKFSKLLLSQMFMLYGMCLALKTNSYLILHIEILQHS